MSKRLVKKLLIVMSVMLFLFAAGCNKRNTMMASSGSNESQMSNFADDIRDINVPAEMAWDRNESIIIKTESFRGGVFVYKGRAEMLSLKDYMVSSMKGNGWRLVGETTSKNIMLAFVKPSRTCMMSITNGPFGRTDLKIYLANDKTGTTGGSSYNNSGSYHQNAPITSESY